MKFFYIIVIIVLITLLTFLYQYHKELHIYKGKLTILYEDNHILVVYKPINISVHDATNWNSYTIVDTLLDNGYKLYDNEIPYQDGVVHRLDVGTSGILIMAKTKYAYNNLKEQFKFRTIKKIYHALIQGIPIYPFGTINKQIGLVDDENNKYGVVDNGKPSVSHYKILRVFNNLKVINDASLIEINLETGRTHQIRVHFSNINHPLVGDYKYGSNQKFNNLINIHHQWLHAKHLEFDHPITKERMIFTIDYPEYLKKSLHLLSSYKLQKYHNSIFFS